MVHFVGAGPGAPDLITVRGQALLKEADIIIYAGSLVNKELLEVAPSHCRIYNSALMTLEEVVDVMIQGGKGRKENSPSPYRRSLSVRRDPGADGPPGGRRDFL